jgi:GntR family transcriptional regulator
MCFLKGDEILDTQFNAKTPIYLQIMDIIKMDIVIGKLKLKDKLPSVREMATKLKVNPNTLQRSYQELERLGIVYTQRGTGTFVCDDNTLVDHLKKEMAKEVIDLFILRMKSLGFTPNEIIKYVSKETMEGKQNV